MTNLDAIFLAADALNTNASVVDRGIDALLLYGPGAIVTIGAWAAYRALSRAAGRIYDQATQSHIPAAPDNTAGVDTDLLNACLRIDNQPDSRKETP
ncbi:hypothetical protein [Streptomyces sp. NPDC059994]|uniref:hypothetical protein n=1 Tax=Streptomyces sp. NPDC059994 TaxID=3347029 RepID=UPI0036828146